MSKKNYPNLTGTQGWEEFISSKEEMLAQYDRAKTKQLNRPIQVNAGRVAEAEFRKWLSNFLPKKYGVTSGYVISQGFTDEQKLLHYDVIIYDQLNSPILWVESNPDNSEQGSIRAIPAEYVHGILEVKSTMSMKSCKEAVKKLDELKPLLEKNDEDDIRYRKFFPPNFMMGIIFFELLKKDQKDIGMLDILMTKDFYKGYMSALVLRGEGLKTINSGMILQLGGKGELLNDQKHSDSLLVPPTPYSISIPIENEEYLTTLLYWAASMFSMYVFGMLGMMEGTNKSGMMASMHGAVHKKEG